MIRLSVPATSTGDGLRWTGSKADRICVGPARNGAAMDELTDQEKAVLDFACGHWKYPGAKDTRIRETFGCSPTRFYARLNDLLDRPEAEAYDILLVRRLRRLRAARQRQRSARALGFVE